MSSAQRRGLVLLAAVLCAAVCLFFLPVNRWVSVLLLLVIFGLTATFWVMTRRRHQDELMLRLENLPEAAYRQPVVLVCGDLPLSWSQP